MKTQILHLDPYDDHSSTRERLRWVKADHIVLVWPSYGRVLSRRLDLVLLQREARRQGALLGIVAHDPDVRDNARDLQIPVFDDLHSISAGAWPPSPETTAPPRLEIERPERPITRRRDETASGESPWRVGWMLVVILALLGLSAVVGPAAVIEWSPLTRPLAATFDVGFREGTAAGLTSRTLEVDVEGSLRLPTQGTVLAPTVRATGSVEFMNREDSEVAIPGGTGLRTGSEGLRFETTAPAILPAGDGSRVTVPIRATLAGESGNVEPGRISAIEGDLGLRATVTNPEATGGGASQWTAGVTESDLAAARAALERQLVQEATAEMTSALSDGESIAPQSVRVERTESSASRPGVGEVSDTVFVEARIRVSGIAYQTDEVRSMAEAAAKKAAGPGRTVIPGSVQVDLEPEDGGKQYVGRVRAQSMPRLDEDRIARRLVGSTFEGAMSLLAETVDQAAPAKIHIWPAWWPRLPLLPWRIHLLASAGRP
jgi:hypothetical protein